MATLTIVSDDDLVKCFNSTDRHKSTIAQSRQSSEKARSSQTTEARCLTCRPVHKMKSHCKMWPSISHKGRIPKQQRRTAFDRLPWPSELTLTTSPPINHRRTLSEQRKLYQQFLLQQLNSSSINALNTSSPSTPNMQLASREWSCNSPSLGPSQQSLTVLAVTIKS